MCCTLIFYDYFIICIAFPPGWNLPKRNSKKSFLEDAMKEMDDIGSLTKPQRTAPKVIRVVVGPELPHLRYHRHHHHHHHHHHLKHHYLNRIGHFDFPPRPTKPHISDEVKNKNHRQNNGSKLLHDAALLKEAVHVLVEINKGLKGTNASKASKHDPAMEETSSRPSTRVQESISMLPKIRSIVQRENYNAREARAAFAKARQIIDKTRVPHHLPESLNNQSVLNVKTPKEVGLSTAVAALENALYEAGQTHSVHSNAVQGSGTNNSIKAGQGSGTNNRLKAGQGSGTNNRIKAGQGSGTNDKVNSGQDSGTNNSIKAGKGPGTNDSMETVQGAGTNNRLKAGQGSGTNNRIKAGQGSGTNDKVNSGQDSGTNNSIKAGKGPGTNDSMETVQGAGTNNRLKAGQGSGTNNKVSSGRDAGLTHRVIGRNATDSMRVSQLNRTGRNLTLQGDDLGKEFGEAIARLKSLSHNGSSSVINGEPLAKGMVVQKQKKVVGKSTNKTAVAMVNKLGYRNGTIFKEPSSNKTAILGRYAEFLKKILQHKGGGPVHGNATIQSFKGSEVVSGQAKHIFTPSQKNHSATITLPKERIIARKAFGTAMKLVKAALAREELRKAEREFFDKVKEMMNKTAKSDNASLKVQDQLDTRLASSTVSGVRSSSEESTSDNVASSENTARAAASGKEKANSRDSETQEKYNEAAHLEEKIATQQDKMYEDLVSHILENDDGHDDDEGEEEGEIRELSHNEGEDYGDFKDSDEENQGQAYGTQDSQNSYGSRISETNGYALRDVVSKPNVPSGSVRGPGRANQTKRLLNNGKLSKDKTSKIRERNCQDKGPETKAPNNETSHIQDREFRKARKGRDHRLGFKRGERKGGKRSGKEKWEREVGKRSGKEK